ncbi:hypothetical protein DL240_13185 [Lujinxingia litoralis]|uniref:Uncharacterized protein n=1 Tax=Lujinxingia litoralis TaxID=2211119 RepID=A0A328C9Z5_9DELT|nr:hypothetical protein [Lujinxingia litoralis]RAL21800.1 hypothetical protein DL240_13185 [Lujinxingia litoralis]
MKSWKMMVMACLLGGTLGCEGGDNRRADDPDAGDSPDVCVDACADVEGDPQEEPEDLGEPCNLICNLASCAEEDEGCEGGICVSHQEVGASYCSRPCVSSCAEGYTCTELEDGSGMACLSNSPECGNGQVEFGEACDGEEGCSEDCQRYTDPDEVPELSGGTITVGFHGNEPTTVEGEEPTVEAHRMGNMLFFSGAGTALTYGLTLPESGAETPSQLLLEVGLVETATGNTCSFVATTMAAISHYDEAAREVAGEANLTLVCQGFCDPCASEVPVELAFDLRWVEREL